jgi:type IV secretion system coupling TraD/TrwB family protein
MTERWGRSESAGTWPRPKIAWTLTACFVAAAVTFLIAAYACAARWTPLQRMYLPSLLQTHVRPVFGVAAGRYQLLMVESPTVTRLALDEDVKQSASSANEQRFALTDAAVRQGARRLTWQSGEYDNARLRRFLAHWVYHDRSLIALMWPAAHVGAGVLLIGLFIAVPADLTRVRERRHGRRLKGPELVTTHQFNRRHRPTGVALRQIPQRFHREICVRIPRALESSHFLVMGDSGTGKSALIRQLLQQLEARDETAIVYDPALEYTGQFYTADRGDLILNPLDERSPYWSPADEWRHEAETLSLAASLFPDRPHENAFFTEAPRRIFAHLLTRRPPPEELARWLSNDEIIDRQLAGTPYATMVDRQAPAQRSGVLASLNMVADTLKLLPPEQQTTRRWSAAAWSRERRGWLFLTSTPETRPRLVPLISLWLDTLVLRLMNQGQPHSRRVWFILDELASLQRLPQLHTAITENRKSNNPAVLGFQGRSQIETRYGHDAEAILSQPATKIFLRTSEPRAAKWISDTIGEVEIERLRESRSSGRGAQQGYGLERQVEPLVMASEIAGLSALCGFLKVGNLVVRLTLPFVHLPNRAPALLERRSLPKPSIGSSDNSGPAPDCAPAVAAPHEEELLQRVAHVIGNNFGR